MSIHQIVVDIALIAGVILPLLIGMGVYVVRQNTSVDRLTVMYRHLQDDMSTVEDKLERVDRNVQQILGFLKAGNGVS